MSKAYNERIKQYIQETPSDQTIIIFNGEKIIGKKFEDICAVVKVARNLFKEGFMNMDICYVLGETTLGQLVIRRIEDNRFGVVNKTDVRYPEWNSYEF